jgi:NAD(P)-dependent dehydrogenase (short-subunit alcohol dehydrogenase family)
MSGKTVAVTGCTTGTGLVLARVCAERGARVLMLNRASTRAQTALQELSAIPGAGQVSFVECDLSSFASVRPRQPPRSSKSSATAASTSSATTLA